MRAIYIGGLACCSLFAVSLCQAKTVSQFEPVKSSQEQQAYKLIKSVEPQLQLLVDELPLQQPVQIVYGAEDGPLFDPQLMQIHIPYSFITEVFNRFSADNYQETGISAATATQDALLHTIGHEYGHAFIYANQVMVLGKEEDAVDTLATLLLINSFDDGADIALSAADLFALEDESIEEFEEQDFADEHSLDAQRYFATLCLIYGSDPQKFVGMLDRPQSLLQNGEYCQEEYFRQSDNWDRLKQQYIVEE
ncbi:hypothetical protein TUM4261_28870 [Shewanella sp. c952]|uniref:DUF4344 domain-containing metallopeptidase n=1 Tax=Shewanella sp. c952 TaxID=2815913 RepID=UPI001BBCF941|nr:DUF4344 domain-containing metallopeptidase [Shewanella sp. c952]GIU13982.1 hypothetical protein TUM4261_28870 [Shewanella sp. c952]